MTVKETLPLITSLTARVAALLVRFYQVIFSPVKNLFFGPYATCRFYPTCSHYAYSCFRRHGLARGGYYAIRRLLRCHPFHPGGHDPVPPVAIPECKSADAD